MSIQEAKDFCKKYELDFEEIKARGFDGTNTKVLNAIKDVSEFFRRD